MGLSELYARIDALNRKISENNRKIEKLEVAKSEVKEAKKTIEEYKSNWSNNVATPLSEDMTWLGNFKNEVTGCAVDGISADYTTFINNIDFVIDAICDKITELENDNASCFGIIGECWAAINSILNELEKCVN